MDAHKHFVPILVQNRASKIFCNWKCNPGIVRPGKAGQNPGQTKTRQDKPWRLNSEPMHHWRQRRCRPLTSARPRRGCKHLNHSLAAGKQVARLRTSSWSLIISIPRLWRASTKLAVCKKGGGGVGRQHGRRRTHKPPPHTRPCTLCLHFCLRGLTGGARLRRLFAAVLAAPGGLAEAVLLLELRIKTLVHHAHVAARRRAQLRVQLLHSARD